MLGKLESVIRGLPSLPVGSQIHPTETFGFCLSARPDDAEVCDALGGTFCKNPGIPCAGIDPYSLEVAEKDLTRISQGSHREEPPNGIACKAREGFQGERYADIP
jgi:hypothetical protein